MKNKVTIIILIAAFVIGLVFAKNAINKRDINGKVEAEEYVISVNSDTFQSEVINSDKKVLIDFYADWCGPCQMLSPIVDEVASENKNIKFVRINTDENKTLANVYRIVYIPTLVLIENGEEIDRLVGLVEKEQIENLIK